MEKYFDVIKRILELTDTCLEGLEYIELKLSEGKYSKSIPLLEDILNGFNEIQKAMEPILLELPENLIELLTDYLTDMFEFLIFTYEKDEMNKALEILNFKLLPGYKRWQEELEKTLKPYIAS